MSAPLVTIIIPTRNRRRLLEDAVRSAQVAYPFLVEILVSDNGSTDETADYASKLPGIRYIRRDIVLAMSDHWNACLEASRGKYIKVLCDDDQLLPGALEREVAELEKNAAVVACASARREISAETGALVRRVGPRRTEQLSSEELFRQMITDENVLGPPSSVTFRLSAFPGFPSAYEYAADWAAWILLAERGPVQLLRQEGCLFRLHDGNLTSRHVEENTDFLEVMSLRKECLRRLGGISLGTNYVRYWLIFNWRLFRRIARLVARARSPLPFLNRAISERRPALPRISRSVRG